MAPRGLRDSQASQGKRLRSYLQQTSPLLMLSVQVGAGDDRPHIGGRQRLDSGKSYLPLVWGTDIFGGCSFFPGPDLSLSFWSYPPFIAFCPITALECIYLSSGFHQGLFPEQRTMNVLTHICSILIIGGLHICKFDYFSKISLQPQKPHLECCWSHSWARACADWRKC